MRKHFISHGPDETKKIGAEIGRLLRPGDVVGLYGELGAGKTTLIKGIASVLGLNEREIASASFTIIAEYETVPPLAHIDLYRVENQTELDELGLWEYLGGDCITVVEWAERAAALLPEDLIKITLEYSGENSREIVIEGNYEKHRDNL
ncbi:MAG: tRNA (adenosine(37)-N6)-threonylcarbamoyltransferase complex ATPase subunit type 1 TsaE [Nitrospirota bacterium]